MEIICPHCQHPMKAKVAKPGRYTPKCAKCGQTFVLTVPEDPTKTVSVMAPQAKPPASKPAQPSAKQGPAKPPPTKTVPVAPRSAAKPAAPPPAKAKPKPPESHPDAPSPQGELPAENADMTAAFDANAVPQPKLEPTLPETEEPVKEKPKTKASGKKAKTKIDLPERLGGYQIVKELGRGGMGAVYLATQLSLDRRVALKVMSPQWASNPTFMARFTREAYAAAQLVHHNVVQVYDIGEDQGVSYFSMEFVEGQSLGELIKKEGKLEPPIAVAYTLQAARGLKFGHDRGMIHRDVKPDNLMLNDQGIIKVADLGLVKTPEMTAADDAPADPGPEAKKPKSVAEIASSSVTVAGTAMGTPAYMSPEQAKDAAKVDRRADIYSLGCTFYALLTGKPPFAGKTLLEVLSKHASAPVIPPDTIVKEVPRDLSQILLKMVAKKADDRYADMGAVIEALQEFEAEQGRGKAGLGEEQAGHLDECVKAFHSATTAKMRAFVPLGFVGGCALLALLSLCFSWYSFLGFLALAVLTPLFYAGITGFMKKTHLFSKVREMIIETTFMEWLTFGMGGLITFLILFFLLPSLFWVGIGASIFAIGIAFAFYFLIDRRLEKQRQPAIDKVEVMLRLMRLQGVEEEALREFVCKYAGEHWEEFYEALFGYQAKLEARERWGKNAKGQLRPKFAAWREPVYRWMETKQKARREAREKKHLLAVEKKNLEAQGLKPAEAQARAEEAAEVMVEKAAEFREASRKIVPLAPDETLETVPQPELMDVRKLLELPDTPEELPKVRRSGSGGKMISWLFSLLFGTKMRFVVGAALLGMCLWWAQTNALIPGWGAPDVNLDNQGWFDEVTTWFTKPTKPLELPVIGDLFNSFNPGVVGLLLILSSAFHGWKMAVIMWPAAAIGLLGHTLGVIPESLQPQYVTMMAAAGLGLLGLLIGRERDRRT